jgi:Lon protease-like protein
MVAVDETHWPAMQGDPPVAAIACEGEIVGAERDEDGTFKLVLRGTRRVRILHESPPSGDRLYRIARVETCPDLIDDADRAALHGARGELFVLLAELVRRTMPDHAGQFGSDRFKGIDDEHLVNAFAQAMDLAPRDKQLLLEVDRVRDRQRMLCELMRFRIAELDGGAPGGSSRVH